MQVPTLSFIAVLATLFNVNNAYTWGNTTYGNATLSTIDKAVFAQYMVGSITEAHLKQDVDDAIAMGLDGFALNVGEPNATYVYDSLSYLFSYAAKTDFKLFISIDSAGAGNVCSRGLPDFLPLFKKFIQYPAYYKGPNNAPFISAFSDGGLQNVNWTTFLNNVANKTYFVPDFDGTAGYYESTAKWWAYWGSVIDGAFSWEAAWPQTYGAGNGGAFAGDVSLDEAVIAGTAAHNKSYMVALSPLQYKDAYKGNYYREGGLNFPTRMKNILSMSPSPDFTDILTWNDGPASTYIGNLWAEQNNDTNAAKYSGPTWLHTGWQPIFTSFIKAFKAKLPATSMAPPEGEIAVGALWYKTILQSSVCNNVTYNRNETWTWYRNVTCPYSTPSDNLYYDKPSNWENGTDAHNWAVVLSSSATSSYTLRTSSNGIVIGNVTLVPGLNYGSFDGVKAGVQKMEVLDVSGNAVLSTEEGPRGVRKTCPDKIYNMNYEVVGLQTASSSGSSISLDVDVADILDVDVGVSL